MLQASEQSTSRGTELTRAVCAPPPPSFGARCVRSSSLERRFARTMTALALLGLVLLAVLGWPLGTLAQPLGQLENPGPHSFQSGIGVISGWVCEAEQVEIELNGEAQPAAYGTERLDTQGVCGDTDNGFGLLFNWNLLGAGEHDVVAYVDEEELGRATVQVTTVGEGAEAEFLRGAAGECAVEDFPGPGETVTLEWQERLQNFVIVAFEEGSEVGSVSGSGGSSSGSGGSSSGGGGSSSGGKSDTDGESKQELEPDPLVTQQQEEDGDDIAAGIETTGTITVGMSWVNKNPIVGRIDHARDEDWYRVKLVADRRYQIDIRGKDSWDYFAQYPDADFTREHAPNEELTLRDPWLRGLYDAEGRYIPGTFDNDGGWFLDARGLPVITQSGYYYIAVGHAPGNLAGGTYDVSVIDGGPPFIAPSTVSEPEGEDFAANQTTQGKAAANSMVTGKIIDTKNGEPVNPYMYYHPAEDRTFRYPDGYTKDEDWFSINLEAGVRYNIIIEEPNDKGILDTYLQVYDSDGNPIFMRTLYENAGSRNGFTYVPEESGTYYLSVRSVDEHPSLTAEERKNFKRTSEYLEDLEDLEDPVDDYQIRVDIVPDDWGTRSVSEPPGDDFIGSRTPVTRGFVLVGDCVTGEIYAPTDDGDYDCAEDLSDCAEDVDSYTMRLIHGQRYQLDMKSLDSDSGALPDPYIDTIYQDAQNPPIVASLGPDGGEGLDARLRFVAKNANEYYVVRLHGQYPNFGTYTLCLAEVADDYRADTATSGRVTVDDSSAAKIKPAYDRDWFAVDFVAGKTYRIALTGDTLGAPRFRGIVHPDGMVVPDSDTSNTYTADETGTYYLIAGARGQGTGTYTLAVAEVTTP